MEVVCAVSLFVCLFRVMCNGFQESWNPPSPQPGARGAPAGSAGARAYPQHPRHSRLAPACALHVAQWPTENTDRVSPKPARKQTQRHFWGAGEREYVSKTFLYNGKSHYAEQLCGNAYLYTLLVSHIGKLCSALNPVLQCALGFAERIQQKHREVSLLVPTN